MHGHTGEWDFSEIFLNVLQASNVPLFILIKCPPFLRRLELVINLLTNYVHYHVRCQVTISVISMLNISAERLRADTAQIWILEMI